MQPSLPSAAGAGPQRGPGSLVLGGALAALVVLVFWPALRGEFVYDDELLFGPTNEATRSVGAALRRAFEPLWSFDRPQPVDAAGPGFERGFWRPLTVLALAVGRALPGDGALGPHVVSLAAHLAAVLVGWRLAARLLGDPRAGALVAALFAVHPLMAEPVAWAAAVNDPLAGFLVLAALLAHARWRDRAPAGAEERGAPLLAGLCALLALLAKEQALVLPLFAAGLDLALGRRPGTRALAPYAVALGLWYVARVFVFRDVLAGLFERQGDFGFPSLARAAAYRVELVGGALALLVRPRDLTVFRPVHPVAPEGDPALLVGAAALVLLALALVAALLRRARVVALGLGLAVAAPALVAAALHTAGRYPLSDRYLYLSVFGAALALVAALRHVVPRAAAPIVVAGLAAAAVPATRAHIAHFADSTAFHARAVALAPKDPLVQVNAGRWELKRFQDTLERRHLLEAYVRFVLSLTAGTYHHAQQVDDDPTLDLRTRIERVDAMLHAPERSPDPTVFWTMQDRLEANLGQLYVHLGAGVGSGLDDLEVPHDIAEQLTKVFAGEGRVWTAKGQVHKQRGELELAEQAFRKALELDRSDLLAWRQLGATLTELGRDGDARRAYEDALRVAPADVGLLEGALAASLREGQLALAESQLARLVAAVPATREAALWRGRVALARSRFSEALAEFDRALALDPGWGEALKHKGLALLRMDDLAGALEALSEAARALPDDFEANYQTAALMGAIRSEAEEDAAWRAQRFALMRRAYELSPPDERRILLQNALRPIAEGNPDVLFSLATGSERRKDLYSAGYWLRLAEEAAGAWPERERARNLGLVLTRFGSVLRQQGDALGAVEKLERAVELTPRSFDALFEYATTLRVLKRFAEAGPVATRALELLPEAKVKPEMRAAGEQMLRAWSREAEALNAAGPPPSGN